MGTKIFRFFGPYKAGPCLNPPDYDVTDRDNYEFILQIQNFEMANPIWWINMQKVTSFG